MTKSWGQLAECFARESQTFIAEYLEEKNKILDHRHKMLDALSPIPKWLADIAENEYKERLKAITDLQSKHKMLLLEKYRVIGLKDDQELNNDKEYFNNIVELKSLYTQLKIEIDNYYKSRYEAQGRYETSRKSFSQGSDDNDPVEHRHPPSTTDSSLVSDSTLMGDRCSLIGGKDSYRLPCGCDDNSIDW